MSKIVVFLNITLDGVVQAPGRADEDTRGGFEHGGWAAPYADPSAGRAVAEGMSGTRAILLGRRTYQDFYGVWPHREGNPFTEILNKTQKYVASTTLREPLPWMNSTLLAGDATDAVAKLRAEPAGDLVILGSTTLVQSLMRRGLIDMYALQVHPLVLGSGRRLFPTEGPSLDLTLVNATPTATGVLSCTYTPAAARPVEG